jgi:hypothetical protein
MRFSQALSQSIMLLLVMAIVTSLAGCQFLGKKGGKSGGNGARTSSGNNPNAKLLLGSWQVSYAVNGDTRSSHMTLTPAPGGFEGTGTDDTDGGNFIVDTGFLAGSTVGFQKRYHVEENPNLPPIVYDGTFEVVANETYKGPYMHGTYKLDKGDGGEGVKGEWDAQKVDAQQSAANVLTRQPPQQQAPAASDVDPSKPPDLSGKWNAGYEYMFKTFHSRMFLEQDGKKITGHGADQNTNENYKITGTYNFPDIKIIHQYPELKLSKKQTKAPRTLEFRGKVEVVNEPEYHGPRMTGKNMGGGDWMAEEVR